MIAMNRESASRRGCASPAGGSADVSGGCAARNETPMICASSGNSSTVSTRNASVCGL